MKRLYGDGRGIGGIAVAIIVALMVMLFFVGAGVVQPMVMNQKLSPGDFFVYSAETSGALEISGDISYRVLSITLTDMAIEVDDISGVVSTENVSWERDGFKLIVGEILDAGPFDMMQAVFNNPADFPKTVSFGMFGLTPMLLDVYSGNSSGLELTVKTKAGTFIPVYVEYTFLTLEVTYELTDTNVGWVSTPMALL